MIVRRIHPDTIAGNQSAIRRHVIALFDQDDVPGNQAFGGGCDQLPVAHDFDVLREQLAQGGNGALGAIFLPEGERTVDQDDGDDGDAELPHALARTARLGEKGQPGSQPQDQGEEVRELAQEAPPLRFAADRLDAVAAVFLKAPLRFSGGQAMFGCSEAVQGIGN